jgi:hypothetical protein
MAPLQWLLQFAIWLDQGANLLVTPFHGGAWADETLSCRSYRMWRDRKPWGRITMPIIDALFWWQKQEPGVIGHCHGAYLKEMDRYNMPAEFRPVKPGS